MLKASGKIDRWMGGWIDRCGRGEVLNFYVIVVWHEIPLQEHVKYGEYSPSVIYSLKVNRIIGFVNGFFKFMPGKKSRLLSAPLQ